MANIGVISYWGLSALIRRIHYQLPPGVNIVFINALLDDALHAAKKLEENNEVDVFVSAGANGYVLSQHTSKPYVEIAVTGFDFLLALTKFHNPVHPIAVITFRHPLSYIESISQTLRLTVTPFTYNDPDELHDLLLTLKKQGFHSVIGGSLVLERAEQIGMKTSFLYSEDGVIRALEAAIKIAETKKAEEKKAEELWTIIQFAYSGIMATDSKGIITVFNPSAEKIIGISRQLVIGQNVNKVIAGTCMMDVIASGQSELNQIQSIGDIKILTNRVPILIKGEIMGAIATFQDIGTIQNAEEKIRQRLYKKGFLAKATFDTISGASEVIEKVKAEASKYAHSESTILITGESGTGKEMFAQAIHNESARSKRSFVAINCAALPVNLLESELFGYAEGAFTGAKKGGKRGVFELAHGGTIFLDEIGEIPMSIQSRLLRVLQEHEILRIGGEEIVPVNIRVLTATNKNLRALVEQGQFREDLYYRLCVLELHLPPLRKHPSDIACLVSKFLSEFRKDLSPQIIRKIVKNNLLRSFEWPGNIRQLKNIIERFAVLYDGSQTPDQIIASIINREHQCDGLMYGKEYFSNLLAQVGGNKSALAKQLGISRTTLWRKLKN
jgi:propionate catabolism operon transcriptional regulator